MNKFTVSCVSARSCGAIGIFYGISRVILANDAAEAEQQFRDWYECNAPVTVSEIPS